MIGDWLRDFRAEGKTETSIEERLKAFLSRHGEAALSREIAGETEAVSGHLTASAWIVDSQNEAVLLVFGRKEGCWKLPGAHCDGDCVQSTKNEVTAALGRAPTPQTPPLWSLAEREIAAYWNTPAHRHFELVFRFDESTKNELPRGAKWFSFAEAAQLGDASISRLLQKMKCQP